MAKDYTKAASADAAPEPAAQDAAPEVTTDTQTPVSIGDTLGSNQTLEPGQYLVSQNGSYEMDMSPWGT